MGDRGFPFLIISSWLRTLGLPLDGVFHPSNGLSVDGACWFRCAEIVCSELEMTKAADEFRVSEKRKNEGKVKDNKIWQQKGIKELMEDKIGTVLGEKILETGAVNGNPNENMASISAAHDLGDLNVTSPIEMVPEKNLDEVRITSQPDLINSADMIQHREGKYVEEIECGQHVQSVIPRDSDNSDEECEEVWHGDEPELQWSAQADRVQTTMLNEEENNDCLGNDSPQGEVTTGYSLE
ncbi:hypothetical protein ACLOJK_029126 [Asimina triloba]